jgi:DNA-binding NarL/FixJ family response regulator
MSSNVHSDLTGLRCLIVEDVAILAQTERRLLSRLGARVAVAATVEEAHRHLATQAFDVAIVDIGLPDGDGAEVVRTALGITPPLAVLVVSGMRDRGKNLELQAMGAIVMDKNALGEHLPHTILAALRRRTPATDGSTSFRSARPSSSTPVSAHPMANDAPAFADVVVGRYASTHRLSGREQEVFALSLQGLGDKAIARVLDVSHSTVRAHWQHIATKVGCDGQRDVIRQFARYLTSALESAEAGCKRQRGSIGPAAAHCHSLDEGAPLVSKP